MSVPMILVSLVCLVAPRPLAAVLAFAFLCSFRSPRVLTFGSLALFAVLFPAAFFALCGLIIVFDYLPRFSRFSSRFPPDDTPIGPLRLRGGANDDGEVPSLNGDFYLDESAFIDDVEAGDDLVGEGLSLLDWDTYFGSLVSGPAPASPFPSGDLTSPSGGVGMVVSGGPAVVDPAVLALPPVGSADLSAGGLAAPAMSVPAPALPFAGPSGDLAAAGGLAAPAMSISAPAFPFAGPFGDLAAAGGLGSVVPNGDGLDGDLATLLLSFAAPFLPAAGPEVDPLSLGLAAALMSDDALSLLPPEGLVVDPSAGGLPAPATSVDAPAVPLGLSSLGAAASSPSTLGALSVGPAVAALGDLESPPPASTLGALSVGPAVAALGDLESPSPASTLGALSAGPAVAALGDLESPPPASTLGALSVGPAVAALGDLESPPPASTLGALSAGSAVAALGDLESPPPASTLGALPAGSAGSPLDDILSPPPASAVLADPLLALLVAEFAALSLSDEALLPLSGGTSSAGSVVSGDDSPSGDSPDAAALVASGDMPSGDRTPPPSSPAAHYSALDESSAATLSLGLAVQVEPMSWEEIAFYAENAMSPNTFHSRAAEVERLGILGGDEEALGEPMDLDDPMDIDVDGEGDRVHEDQEEVWDLMDILEEVPIAIRRDGRRGLTVLSRRRRRRRRMALPLGVPAYKLSGPYIVPWYKGSSSWGERRRNAQSGALVEYYTHA